MEGKIWRKYFIVFPMFLVIIIFVVISIKGQKNASDQNQKFEEKKQMEEDNQDTIVGVDFGVTYSSVAIYQNGRVNIIPNEFGSYFTPSVVSFSEHEILVGDDAKRKMTINPNNTIFGIKRFIGLHYNDTEVQHEINRLPYKIIKQNDRPFVEVQFEGKAQTFSPEEITALILQKMKRIAENYLSKPIKNALITVPSYFNMNQWKAIIHASSIAGLNVVRILNEPVAASLAYGYNKREKKTNLVLDLGGGSFSSSIFSYEDNLFEILAVNGDTHFSGDDFDESIIKYLIRQYKKKTGKDCTKNLKAISKLKREAEKAKRDLSIFHKVTIEIESFNDGDDFIEILTRDKFEQLNAKLFNKIIPSIKDVIKDSGLSKNDIDNIIFVGGSSRIPKIQQIVGDFFGKNLSKDINPEEAIVWGAAIEAERFSNKSQSNHIILQVNPHTIGIETVGGFMKPMIFRNSRLPTSKSEIFTIDKDKQKAIKIKIYEGERQMTKYNHFVTSYDLMDIKPAARGVPKIRVNLDIDSNGLLTVSAEDLIENISVKVLPRHDINFSEEEREEVTIIEVKSFKKTDRSDLKSLCIALILSLIVFGILSYFFGIKKALLIVQLVFSLIDLFYKLIYGEDHVLPDVPLYGNNTLNMDRNLLHNNRRLQNNHNPSNFIRNQNNNNQNNNNQNNNNQNNNNQNNNNQNNNNQNNNNIEPEEELLADSSPPHKIDNLSLTPFNSAECKDSVCSICIDELIEGEEVIVLECGHPYHLACIAPWIQDHHICPTCRAPISNL